MSSTQEISTLNNEKQQRCREQIFSELLPSKKKRNSDQFDSEAAFGQWFQALPVYSQRQILSSVDFELLEHICEASVGNQRFRAEICDNDSFWVQWLDYHWPQHRLVTDAQVQAMGSRTKARYFAHQLSTLIDFVRALQFDPRVSELTIQSSTYIFKQGWSILSQNQSITSLEMSSSINRNMIIQFIQSIDTFRFLTTLEMDSNEIDDEGARVLAQNHTLTTLNLQDNRIKVEGARALAQNNTLTTIVLKQNRIGDEGARALSQNYTLTSLNLSANQIGVEGACALAQNCTLTFLDLEYNLIGDEGAQALAQNSILTSLSLNLNLVGDRGTRALAKNRTLTNLFLRDNQIGNAGGTALAQNSTLTALNLSFNQIAYDGVRALVQNHNLTYLNLEYNRIGDEEKNILRQTTALTSLLL